MSKKKPIKIKEQLDKTLVQDSPSIQYKLEFEARHLGEKSAHKTISAGDADFSDFIVYVDESGDHSLVSIDPQYPVFVLSCCIFFKTYYADKVVPYIQKFKFKHFGHDLVVLHENEIRKEKNEFNFKDRQTKLEFLGELSGIIEKTNFVLLSCIINKQEIKERSLPVSNPYFIALSFCLETLFEFLKEKRQENRRTHVIFECRGKKEDAELELEFRRICDGANKMRLHFPFEVVFADKKVNSSGLQLADLVARPIGLSFIRPDQPNRAFEVLKKKFFSSKGRKGAGAGFENWGLKIYPPIKAKSPDELTEAIAPTGHSQST